MDALQLVPFGPGSMKVVIWPIALSKLLVRVVMASKHFFNGLALPSSAVHIASSWSSTTLAARITALRWALLKVVALACPGFGTKPTTVAYCPSAIMQVHPTLPWQSAQRHCAH